MTPSAAWAWNSTTSRAREASENLEKSSEILFRGTAAGLRPERDEFVADRTAGDCSTGLPVALATAIGDYLEHIGLRQQSGAMHQAPPAHAATVPPNLTAKPPRNEPNTAGRHTLLNLAR
jgi:hypothetical protein